MKEVKILFADLDDTIIKTSTGNTFPKGIWDMKFNTKCLDAIKKLKPTMIFIVSNQGGIELGFVDELRFKVKMLYVIYAVRDYCGIECDAAFCPSNDKNHPDRKPNTGLLSYCLNKKSTADILGYTKQDCLMIGDASGKEGQFSDTDKKTAENFGIDYLDVNDFIEEMYEEKEPD